MSKAIYFAYGSNMSTERLFSRIPQAKILNTGKIVDKKLLCNKKSIDRSGKANLVDSPGNVVHGVLYEIKKSHLNRLDKFEEGYKRKTFEILTEIGISVLAESYISSNCTDDPRPFKAYKKFIVEGAIENELPQYYIDYLRQIPTKD